MSHVRHTPSQGGSGDAAASPADRQKAMQVEQLQVYKQCQFILKPRPIETLQQHVFAGEIICRVIIPELTGCRCEILINSIFLIIIILVILIRYILRGFKVKLYSVYVCMWESFV